MITVVMMILSEEVLMISQENDARSRAESIILFCFSISVSAQLSMPVRFLICFSSGFFFSMHLINWWPHSAAWKWRILGKTEHFGFLVLLGPVALRLNGLLKKRHTLQPLFSCSFPLSIVPLHCFNQVHCRIIWRRGGGVPLSFSGSCLLNCSSVWPVRAAFQQHHRPPPSHLSALF